MFPRLYASYKGQSPIEMWRATPTVRTLTDSTRRHILKYMTGDWDVWVDHPMPQTIGAQKPVYRRTILNAPQKSDDVLPSVIDIGEEPELKEPISA